MNKHFLYGIDIAAPKNTFYSILEIENNQVVKASVLKHNDSLTTLIAKIADNKGAVCIDVPLSWDDDSATDSRGIEEKLRRIDGVKSNWVLAPNSLRGSVISRGQRLARGLKQKGVTIYESHPRVLLVRLLTRTEDFELVKTYKGAAENDEDRQLRRESCVRLAEIIMNKLGLNLDNLSLDNGDIKIINDDQVDALILAYVLFWKHFGEVKIWHEFKNTGYGSFLLLADDHCVEYELANSNI